MTNYHSADPLHGPSWSSAEVLWRHAEIGPADVDVAQLYDTFTPLIPLSLEGYGFSAHGEGAAFTEDGRIAWPDGTLPINTSGGGLSGGVRPWFESHSRRRTTSTGYLDLPGPRRAVLVGDER